MSARKDCLAWLAVLALLLLACSCGSSTDETATISGTGTGGGGGGGGSGDDTAGDDTATSDDDTTPAVAIKVAVIYSVNLNPSAVDHFGAVLADFGIETIGVDELSITAGSFIGADVILIDYNTDISSDAAISAVMNSALPILALGSGGLYFYAYANFASGFYDGTGTKYSSEDSVQVLDPSHAIFKGPSVIDISGDGSLTLMNIKEFLYGPYIGDSLSVSVLASSLEDSTRGAVMLENGIYMSWGFEFDALDLNTNGANLLANCLKFLAKI